jgi:ABC-type nitrate/sulfonate/bicarbonate transport system substrate-binding protein
MTKRIVIAISVLCLLIIVVIIAGHRHVAVPTPQAVRFAISPFQDTLVPIIAREKGWYREEGLDVQLQILDWTAVQEALSAGHADVGINNISSVVATYARNPQLVYWYGFNTFDNGFALMIRPNGKLRTLAQIEKEVGDHQRAVALTAAQLRGKTVVTTSNTDMEQGVAAAARRGGLDFVRDVHIIDLNPDEGLAAFLRGAGDAFIGGVPQRTRAAKEGMLEMLTGVDIGPAPINGLVTTKKFASEHPDVLLKLLHAWFRSVNYVDKNMDDGAKIIITELNGDSGAQFTIDDFRRFWNNYEHYPPSPAAVQALILDPQGTNSWKARWDDCNHFFYNIKHTIPAPVNPVDAFLMEDAQKQYVAKYGWN